MKLRKTAAKATVLGVMAIAAAGVGSGLANADPHKPLPPWPIPGPDLGPGANVAGPGTPWPPGHGGPMPQSYRGDVPDWAPPAPPPPYWAPWLPVEWNWDFNAWGVYVNGGFQTI